MIKNIAGTIGVAILTALLFIFVLSPMLEPMVGQVAGGKITPAEWMAAFTNWCLIACGVCLVSVIVWVLLSAHTYPIDPSGTHTQMPYWILHALPPLAAALAGYFIQPAIADGWLEALLVILIPILLQYWISSVFFSPNPRSVMLATLVRRK